MFVSLNVCLRRLEIFVLPQLGIIFCGARRTPSPTLRVMPFELMYSEEVSDEVHWPT